MAGLLNEELNQENFDKDLIGDIDVKGYCVTTILCSPFIKEIKNLLKRVKMYRYVEDPKTGKVDHIRTRSIVILDGIENLETIEKYPIITVGRSAIQFNKSSMNSLPLNKELGAASYIWGQNFNTNINIKIECKTQLDVERLSSLIAYHLRINQVKISNRYKMTAVTLDYLSQPIPVKGANDEAVDCWQVGINISLRVDELVSVTEYPIKENTTYYEISGGEISVDGIIEEYEGG